MSNEGPIRVLGFGTYDLHKHPRIGIVLEGLRAHGDDVVTVNEPLGIPTNERVAMLSKPWLAYRLVLRLLRRWITLTRRARRAARTGRFDAILVGYLDQFDVLLARALFPRSIIVLDMLIFGADTARDRGMRGGLKLRVLDTIDRLAVRCATYVLLDTDEAFELLSPRAHGKAVVVPVGAAQHWFDAAPSSPVQEDKLKVAFFGLYTPLQGATVIGETLAELAAHPDIAVTMIGTGQDYDATRAAAAPNPFTTWLDWVESDDLAHLVATHDVCLGIFGTTPKALRVVPNKVYEGAAAGCAIITSDTSPQQRMFGTAVHYVPPGDPGALAAAIIALRDHPDRTRQLREAALSVARERFTPAAIVVALRERLHHP
jgi:glycosyltransferase involved in cell wall biosynthesis